MASTGAIKHMERQALAPPRDLAVMSVHRAATVAHFRGLLLASIAACRARPGDRAARKRLQKIYREFQTVLPAVAFIVSAALASPAMAAGADCGLISNDTLRRQCYAERDKSPSSCATVRDRDAYRICRLRAGARY